MKKTIIARMAVALGLGLVGLAILDVWDDLKPATKAKFRKVLKEVLIEKGLISK